MSSLSPSKRKKIKDESRRTKNTANSASLISEELSPDEKEKRIVLAGTKVQETMRTHTNQTTAEDSDEDE